MKKLETLKKELETLKLDEAQKIAFDYIDKSENVNADTLTIDDLMILFAYNEIKKAITNKSRTLIYDVNFSAKSAQSADALKNARVLLNDDKTKANLHLYAHFKRDLSKTYYDICISCAEHARALYEAQDKLMIVAKLDKNKKAKTCVVQKVAYEDLINTITTVFAILSKSDK